MTTRALRLLAVLSPALPACTPLAGEVGSVEDSEFDPGRAEDTTAPSGDPGTSGTEFESSGPAQTSGHPRTTGADGSTSVMGTSGSTAASTAPETTGPESSCGNGVLEPGEDCDDANFDNEDGCNAGCVLGGTVVWEEAFETQSVQEVDFDPSDALWVLAGGTDALTVFLMSAAGVILEEHPVQVLQFPPDTGAGSVDVGLAAVTGGVYIAEARFWSEKMTSGQYTRISWQGDDAWSVDLPDRFLPFIAARPGGGVVAGGSGGTVEAFDAGGTGVWSWSGGTMVGLAAGPDMVVVVEHSRIVALDASGNELWVGDDPISQGRRFATGDVRPNGAVDTYAGGVLPRPAAPGWVQFEPDGSLMANVQMPATFGQVLGFSSSGRMVWAEEVDAGVNLVKSDAAGDAIWTRFFNHSGVAALAVGSDGRVAAAGLVDGDSTLRLFTP